uniref:signal-induced proliferation-associated 1-like protein 3 n=1 Tax=Lonchura striata TaxID=40157 RepID=UPI000B4C4A65
MSSQRSEIPALPKMGVRARVAEWPPRSKDSPEIPKNPRNLPPSQPSFKPFHRRFLPSSKELEFQDGILGIPLRQRSSSEATLSECDAEETPESRGNSGLSAGFFREYGSTSSIDVQGIPEQSFFQMLDEFRAKKPEFSAGKSESRDDENHEEIRDEIREQQPKEKPRRRCLKTDDSIFKKLRSSRHDADAAEDSRIPEAPKAWICRKSFAHFDVQSILFEAVSARSASTRRRNTTTGASAASAGADPAFPGAEDQNSKENLERDLGDNTSNELLLSCPHFRNEIGGGGGGERDVSFAKSAFSAAPNSGFFTECGNGGKVSNAGVSILEFPKEQRRNPERVGGYGVEHADLGATYYRDYFLGKGLGFWDFLGIYWEFLATLRGSILEDATPSTAKAGSGRGIPARDLLEFLLPELNIHCLRLALASPKVPEQLLKLDEQG